MRTRPTTAVQTTLQLGPTDAPTPETAARQNNVTLIRWILAVGVVFAHAWEISGHNEQLARLTGQMDTGTLAVDAFMILSGYLILQSREHSKGTIDFFKRRILRIYPAYLAVSIVGLLATHQWLWFIHPSILRMLILVQALSATPFGPFGAHGWDGQMWTVYQEMLCYIGLAVAWSVGLFRLRWLSLLTFIGMAAYFWHGGYKMIAPDPPRLYMFFVAGCVMYQFRDVLRPNKMAFLACLAVLVAGVLIGPSAHLWRYMIPVLLPYVLIYLSFACRQLPWIKDDLSYGAYVWGLACTEFWMWITADTVPAWVLFVASMVTVTPLALISWRYIEKPALALKNRQLLPRQRSTGDPPR